MMGLRRNRTRRLWIPHNNIGIRSGLDASLSRIQIENLGRIRTGHRHEFARINDAGMDSLLPDDGHPIFDAIHAVRNFGEIVQAEFLMRFVEGAIVTARRLQMVAGVPR